jgi:hypothetical protein
MEDLRDFGRWVTGGKLTELQDAELREYDTWFGTQGLQGKDAIDGEDKERMAGVV